MFAQAERDAYAVDAATGRLLWKRRIQWRGAFPWATVYLARGGRVYVSQVDSVYALDGATGQTVWSTSVPHAGAQATPAFDEATLYTGISRVPIAQAYALATGEVRWATDVSAGRAWTYGGDVTGAAVSGDTVYVNVIRFLTANGGERTGVLVALDRRDGRELWRYQAPSTYRKFHDAPLVAPGRIIVHDYLGFALVAIDPATQREVWKVPLDRNGPATSVLSNGVIYSANRDATVTAVEARTGAVRWRAPIGSSAYGGLLCGGAIIVSNDWLRRLDLSTGRELGRLGGPVGDFAPITPLATDGEYVYGMGRFVDARVQQETAFAVRCR